MRRHRTLVVVLVGAMTQAGCGTIAWPEPWVQPYERERLASPLMRWTRDTLAERHRAHVHEVREAARGATSVQGGGCGCN